MGMLRSCSLLFYLWILAVKCEEAVSVEVDAEGQQTEEAETKNPNALEVIFENQSGKSVELYWDDGVNGVVQSELSHTSEITINTFIGHRFYFTPAGSGGDKKTLLYAVIMESYSALITLYDERTMKKRGKEFEREKNEFLRQYFEETGIRWKNYYPRQPLTHFMHNFTAIGQEIPVTSSHRKFVQCDAEVIGAVTPDIEQQKAASEDGADQDAANQEDEGQGVAKFFSAATEQYEVQYYNGSWLCREKVGDDMTITIRVMCTSPKVAYFDNFVSPEEGEHIKQIGIALGLQRSTVSEEALLTEDRTSSTVWIERKHSPIIDNIVKRISDVLRIDEGKLYLNQSSESLQLVHYLEGQLYKSHVDYGTDRPHNRYVTFLMYLNTVGGGGFTSFPRANASCKNEDGYFAVEPVQGRVAFFYDLLRDANVDELTQHYAEPPNEGNEKWMTNLWIWDSVFTR